MFFLHALLLLVTSAFSYEYGIDRLEETAVVEKLQNQNQMTTLQQDHGVHKLVHGLVINHHHCLHGQNWNNVMKVLQLNGQKVQLFRAPNIGVVIVLSH